MKIGLKFTSKSFGVNCAVIDQEIRLGLIAGSPLALSLYFYFYYTPPKTPEKDAIFSHSKYETPSPPYFWVQYTHKAPL